MISQKTLHLTLNCWLLLSFPIMESLAFTSTGTMTKNFPKNSGKPVKYKKILVKRIGENFTPLTNNVLETSYAPPPIPEIPGIPENETLPTYRPSYHISHPALTSGHQLPVEVETETMPITMPETTSGSDSMPIPISGSDSMLMNNSTMNKVKAVRYFGNFFPGSTAVIESALKISIPIPFCQFEGSPCEICYFTKISY